MSSRPSTPPEPDPPAPAVGMPDVPSLAELMQAIRAKNGDLLDEDEVGWKLERHYGPRAVDSLVALLVNEDESEEVRATAAYQLGKTGDPRVVDRLAPYLHAPNIPERITRNVLAGLGHIPVREAVVELFNVAHDSRRPLDLRKFAVWGLGPNECDAALPALAELLGDSLPEIRDQVIKELCFRRNAKGDSRITQLTLPLLRDPSGVVRTAAAVAAKSTGDKIFVAPLIAMLQHETYADAQYKAIEALGYLRDPVAVPTILPFLSATGRHIREAAAKALGSIGDPATVKPLLEVLRHEQEHDDVRLRAAESLAYLHDAGGVDFLVALASASERRVPERTRAIASLESTRSTTSTDTLLRLLADDAREIRYYAAGALGEIGDVRAVEPLISLMNGDADREVRNKAADALGKMKDPRAAQALRSVLNDRQHPARAYAAEALGRHEQPSDFSLLRSLILYSSENDSVRCFAAGGLVYLGHPDTLDTLLEALALPLPTTDWFARLGIVRALEQLGDVQALPHVREALELEYNGVVYDAITEAIDTLEQIESQGNASLAREV